MTTRYKVKCPICNLELETGDMQDAHDWGRLHRYKWHKGMEASDMPVRSVEINEDK